MANIKQSILIIFTTSMLFVGVAYSGDFDDGVQAYNNNDYETAFNLFRKAAEQGEAGAQYYLGLMYYNGYGVRQDKSKAKNLYGVACDGGVQESCNNYRILNEQGVQ